MGKSFSIQFDEVKQFITGLLNKNLDPRLTYHDVNHTITDVLPAVERLAGMEGVNGAALVNLRTAALFHDVGFLDQYEKNEAIAVAYAKKILPRYGYSPEQVGNISLLIMVTQLPQNPKSIPEKIICDADLDSLGREDFYHLSMKLRDELSAFQKDIGMGEWLNQQRHFLKNHTYHTTGAKILRDPGKIENIAKLHQLYVKTSPTH